MGNCGEAAAEKFQITREAQDAHAIESYKRAERAWKAGVFDAEIAPVTIKGKKGDTIVKEDEEYKRVIYEKIPTLNPSFKKQGGTITPANSSSLNDGASALILMSAAKAQELGVKPLAKIICMLFLFPFSVFELTLVFSVCRCRCGADRLPLCTYTCSAESAGESKPHCR